MKPLLSAALLSLLFLCPAAYSAGDEAPVAAEHAQLECADCHSLGPTQKRINCLDCHDRSDHIHPINGELPQAAPTEVQVFGNTLHCQSCHQIHEPTGRYLLRNTQAEENLDVFCDTCHEVGLALPSPHIAKGGTTRCTLCHKGIDVSEILAGKQLKLRVHPDRLCNFCHDQTGKGHPRNIDTSLKLPEELPRDDNGNITCVTCHNPHGSDSYTHFIRERYAIHFEKVKGTDVHVEDPFGCDNCHVASSMISITKESHELRFKGDDIMLCVSCHIRARSHHPVGIPLDEALTKKLADLGNPVSTDNLGRISCTTCHTNNCDTDNRHMSEYAFTAIPAKLDLCWYCHEKEELAKTNPHESNEAELNDRCMFCHDRTPVKGLQRGNSYFVSSVRFMCLICHEDISEKDLMHVTVFPREGMLANMADITENTHIPFPLASDGKITCTTCHNAHFSKANSHKTRLEGESMCTMCHPGGGFTGYH